MKRLENFWRYVTLRDPPEKAWQWHDLLIVANPIFWLGWGLSAFFSWRLEKRSEREH